MKTYRFGIECDNSYTGKRELITESNRKPADEQKVLKALMKGRPHLSNPEIVYFDDNNETLVK